MEDVLDVLEERYLGYHFVRNSGPQHNRYHQDLSNQLAQGKNNYPLQEAYDLLQKYEKNPTAQAISEEGTAFAQYEGKCNQNQDKGKKGKKGKKKDENAPPASQQSFGGWQFLFHSDFYFHPAASRSRPLSRADYNKMVAAKDKYKHSYTTLLLERGDDQSVTLSERTHFQTVEIARVSSGDNDTLPD
jgi:hypothetical protein